MRLAVVVVAATLMAPMTVMAWPWSQDMMNQPSIKPQEGPMQVFPQRSIPAITPVMGALTEVANRDEANGLVNPIPVSEASLKKGKTLFKIYCGACHGLTGKADSPVSPKIGAISLADDYAQKNLTEGWIFGTITFGSAIMPAYGVPSAREDKRGSNDLSIEERWHVVNYVRNRLVKDGEAEAPKTAAAQ